MNNPYLSIVIPAYNETNRIEKTLRTVIDYLNKQTYSWELLVVNDGSTDSTIEVLEKLKIELPHLKIISYDENQGKGYAVNQGIKASQGELILFCDADNATPFEQADRLLKASQDKAIVIGSRHLKGSVIHLKQTLLRRVLARMGNGLIQFLLLPGMPDTQCGFKLFRRNAANEIIRRQTIWRWGFDIELLFIAKKLGLKIAQVPVDWYDRQGSKIQSPKVFLTTLGELFRIKWRSLQGKYR